MNRRGMLQVLAGLVVGAPVAMKLLPRPAQLRIGLMYSFGDVRTAAPLRYPSAIAARQDWKSGQPRFRYLEIVEVDHAKRSITVVSRA